MQNPNDDADKPEKETQTKPFAASGSQITRRTLFGVVAGLAALRTACADAESPTPNGPVSVDEPGLLAQSLLNPDVVALMTGATRFCAMRGTVVMGSPNKDAKSSIIFSDMSPYEKRLFSFEAGIFRQTFYSNYSPLFCQGLPYGEPTAQETAMARRLATLLLRDEIWTESGSAWRLGSIPFKPDFVFRFADEFPGVVVSFCPNAHRICIEWLNKAASRTNSLLFDPIGEEMTAFIKEAFPNDADAQALTFAPLPAPLPTRPADFPEAAWDKIMALRPGMTRADVCRIYSPSAGFSSRSLQKVIVPSESPVGLYGLNVLKSSTGQVLQITVRFAPAPAIPKAGSAKRNDKTQPVLGDPWKDDVIVSVSDPFYGQMTAD